MLNGGSVLISKCKLQVVKVLWSVRLVFCFPVLAIERFRRNR